MRFIPFSEERFALCSNYFENDWQRESLSLQFDESSWCEILRFWQNINFFWDPQHFCKSIKQFWGFIGHTLKHVRNVQLLWYRFTKVLEKCSVGKRVKIALLLHYQLWRNLSAICWRILDLLILGWRGKNSQISSSTIIMLIISAWFIIFLLNHKCLESYLVDGDHHKPNS